MFLAVVATNAVTFVIVVVAVVVIVDAQGGGSNLGLGFHRHCHRGNGSGHRLVPHNLCRGGVGRVGGNVTVHLRHGCLFYVDGHSVDVDGLGGSGRSSNRMDGRAHGLGRNLLGHLVATSAVVHVNVGRGLLEGWGVATAAAAAAVLEDVLLGTQS